jgi:hypothetical protein
MPWLLVGLLFGGMGPSAAIGSTSSPNSAAAPRRSGFVRIHPISADLTDALDTPCVARPSIPATTAAGHRSTLKRLLLTACDIPVYGKNDPAGWMIATGGGLNSPACPTHPLSKVRNQGYASAVFDPQSNSAPELFEELIKSGSAKAEFATLRRDLDLCISFTESIPPEKNFTVQQPTVFHGHLAPLALPTYGDQSAGYLQTIPVVLASPPAIPKAQRKFIRAHHLHLPSIPKSIKLLTGSVLIRKGHYLMLVAFFPGTLSFKPGQLEPYVLPALAKLPG